MYLSKIELKNIRCFDELTIDLKKDEDIILWATISGDNAVGKSTILKCIAIGLCDEASAAALMKESKGEFLRKGEFKGSIKLTLEDNSGKKIEINTQLIKGVIDEPVKLSQIITEGESPWNDLFFCGYGASIPGGGGEGFEKYKPLEAVYSLFNYSTELQNPEVLMLRQEPSFRHWLDKKLLNILMLDEYKVKYNKKGMFFTGPWGEFRLDELSDGYTMMSLKIYEIFGWAILADIFNKEGDEIIGILLLDELETHLHPKWQRNVVDRLKRQFPKMQIIVTTHSPIIALGTADLENALMVELEFDPFNETVARNQPVEAETYKGLTVDQILTSPPFKLPIARSGITGDKLIEFRALFMNEKRTEEEEKKFMELKNELDKDIPEAGETEMDRKLQKELRDELKKINLQIEAIKDDKT